MEHIKKFRILAVDDEKSIRIMFSDYFEDIYDVSTAQNSVDALNLLKNKDIDLVVSDINMPGLSGPKLLAKVKKLYPHIKTVLMTAYNVDDYVRIAKEIGISSIIPKTVPFNFEEVEALLDGLLKEEIFGLERFMQSSAKIVKTWIVRSSDEGVEIRNNISQTVGKMFGTAGDVRLILDELITNAIYHAPQNKDGTVKYKEYSPVVLDENEYIYVTLAYDSEKYAISITDMQGKLTKEQILYKLDRHIRGEGILDESGRGIHMSRIFADRMIINIKPNIKTEIIIINYFTEKYSGYRPLYINQL